jgi:hypothetical protein
VPYWSSRSLLQGALSNLGFRYLPELHLLISYQGVTDPSDAEWDAYLTQMRKALSESKHFRSLVVTDGARPSRSQQRRMTTVVEGRCPRVAVVSSSATLRFVVSILALLNRRIQCFDSTQHKAALNYLGLVTSDQLLVEATIERLRRQVALADMSAA